ncbi:prephenate dehydrogenase [Sulfurifustis variabilis]|uniref:prephenate dehydrogenase n=1 Tax=Sulfurifustis variabilis TaxID=1675686 RepID=A0A1B4VAF1_9GAMM|nr:prephenate dehydrogenase/arogenate dehydrogenase family protein [Sulfurifustis variabilis]BAU48624.1 prephenate dehydrogenase [Sulfurifustis variabilis]
MIDKLAIIGVGLMGGSLARALRERNEVGEIVGYGRTIANLDEAIELNVIDHAETSIAAAVDGADMIVLAVPVGAMREVLDAAAPAIGSHAVVTDVGSVKQTVIDAARAALGPRFASFVPGHPIAGTEQSGARAARGNLYEDRRVILTPGPETDPTATGRVTAMWRAVGAEVVSMPAADHDRVLAASSHLPHALAYALVDMLVRLDDHRSIFECAGGGFRDFTRIAASDPVMWRDICLANREPLLALLEQYQENLRLLGEALERADGEWLRETFARAKRAREGLHGPGDGE